MKLRIRQEGFMYFPQYKKWWCPWWSDLVVSGDTIWGNMIYFTTLQEAKDYIATLVTHPYP